MRDSTISPELGLLGVLAAAWPGVKINRLTLHLDTRSPDSIGGEAHADQLSVDLSLSAQQSVLLEHGLVTPEELQSLSRSGRRQFSAGTSIQAGKRVTRLECYWIDPEPDCLRPRCDFEQRLIDRMAVAIAIHTLSALRG